MDDGRIDGVLVRRAGGAWASPGATTYQDEAHMQSLLAAEPGWIPGVADDALTATELVSSAGPIDVCAVGPDGSLTVVECKLASNSERRRMVVGQVIDYASAIWIDGPDAFFAGWRSRTGDDLAMVLGSEATDRLRLNIRDGRVAICLAVDSIDADLRRLVEYLNLISSDEVSVTAIQLAYARDGDVEILIPSTFGAELAAAKSRSFTDKVATWTISEFVDALNPDDRKLAERLFQLSDQHAENVGATGDRYYLGRKPNGQIFFHIGGAPRAPFSIWINQSGELMVWGAWTNWQAVKNHQSFGPLAQLLGQSHTDSSKSVPLSSVDIEALWRIAVDCTAEIND